MKKLNILLMTAVLVSVFAAPSFAMLRKDLMSVKGTVVFVNATRTQVTVKDSTTGKEVTFSAAGVGAEIASGSPVIVLYKKGTTNATTIRLIKKGGGAAPAASASSAYRPQATSTAPAAAPAAAPAKSKYGW